MKKTILLAAAFGLIAAGTVHAVDSSDGSNEQLPGSGISGTKHDLSSNGIGSMYPSENRADGLADPLDRVCIWCHAPHHTMTENESGAIKYLPLWNHEVTVNTYTTYQSDFGEGPNDTTQPGEMSHVLNADDGQPGSVSLLCLSCHDGSIAVNEYGRAPQRDYSESTGGDKIDAQFNIGGSAYGLLNHHPIGFDYTAVAAVDDEIAPVTKAFDGVGGILTIGSLLYDNKMECVTCHDVHNSKHAGETFLWISDRNSAFCLTCHEKQQLTSCKEAG